MQIYMNLDGAGMGGPQVWASRFIALLLQRGYQVTHRLNHNWDAALFIAQPAGISEALGRQKQVAFRVANGYDPGWFQATGRRMKPEHHMANAAIAQALQSADQVIYQSNWAKGSLDGLLYPRGDRYAVIYNGVDLSCFSPGNARTGDLPVLGTVGALRYRFRLRTFFELSRRLDFDHRLLVVGSLDEECREEVSRYQADPQVGPRIMLQAPVPADALPELYRQMTLLVHPVSGDACPNVVVEALACGVPVVVPRFGGASEVAGDAAAVFDSRPWIYDDAFVDAMAEATQSALAARPELSTRARHRAESILDIQEMVTRYLASLGLPAWAVDRIATRRLSRLASLRQTGARLVARPRFLAAVAIRKARQAQRRIFPPLPNPRPRVAFTLFDFHVGGIENWLYRLARELHGQFDFYFLATRAPEVLPRFQEVGSFAFLPGPVAMSAYLQRNNIDIVQVHNERWPVDAALAAGVPCIVERLGGERSWRRVPKYGLDGVIASAGMAASAIAGMIDPSKVAVIYNGIDLEEVDAAPRHRLLPDDCLVLGRTSRFGHGQNLNLLIEAVSKLHATLPELHLVLVGGDSVLPGAQPVEQALRQQAAGLGIDKHVHFTGIVENPLPLVKGFDIGMCVSSSEGIPNSLIEAMACGKPVIATDVGAIPELVDSEVSGLLIPPNDLETLCAAIQRLSQDPGLRRRMGEAARLRIEQDFSLKRAAQAYALLYRQLLEQVR